MVLRGCITRNLLLASYVSCYTHDVPYDTDVMSCGTNDLPCDSYDESCDTHVMSFGTHDE